MANWRKAIGSIGGARVARRGSVATIYSVEGIERRRESAAGSTTMVSPLLDPRLKLTPRQRITGQAYGGYLEETMKAGGSEFLREKVSGGSSGSGGASERHIYKMALVRLAHHALNEMPKFTYPLGKPRGKQKIGQHRPIGARELADLICVEGQSFEYIALSRGWWVERIGKDGAARAVVPDRQRKAIAEALRQVLEGIDSIWKDHGMGPPYETSGIDVE